MKYPFLDLRAVNEPFFAELKEAACRVVESGRYIGEPRWKASRRRLLVLRACLSPWALATASTHCA